MATWRPYLFFDPHDNTVFAQISKIVQDRGLPLPLFTYRKSYMKLHSALFSLPLSDLERSIQVTGFQWPISKSIQDNHRVTIGDG